MFKRLVTILTTCAITVSAVACRSLAQQADSTQTVSSESTQEASDSSEEVKEETSDSASETETTTDTGSTLELGLVSNTLAEDEEGLVETYTDLFDQLTYTDEETGLSITYNLYLPEGYDENAEYPMVVFIGDSTTAGTDAEYSLTHMHSGMAHGQQMSFQQLPQNYSVEKLQERTLYPGRQERLTQEQAIHLWAVEMAALAKEETAGR